MGIKHYYSWFKKNFGHNIKKIRPNQSAGVYVDNLLLDVNGIFHNATQYVYKYGRFANKSRLLKTSARKSTLKNQMDVFNIVTNTIDTLVKVVNPQKRLVICVDGPAPLSKQNQQRSRRFKSSKEGIASEIEFNPNSITPGTKFMDHLSRYIDWFIHLKMSSNDEFWNSLEIVYSSQSVPGEGEHKAFDYIRKYGDYSEVYCINGMDADLIMISLVSRLENFYIIRDETYDPTCMYNLIDIGASRKDIVEHLRSESEEFVFDDISAINDFVYFCFLLGNDFLPHVPSIAIVENGIELFIEIYQAVFSEHGHLTSYNEKTREAKIREKAVSEFFQYIAIHEKENFERKLNKKESIYPDEYLNSFSTQENGEWVVDIKGYREGYMQKFFEQSENVKDVCHSFLQGTQWVLSYYTSGVPSWNWYYPYHYAPLAFDIAKYAKTFVNKPFVKGYPSSPFQQLLCVLPPASSDLLPPELAHLLILPTSPLKQFCPDEIVVDKSGIHAEWEGKVILPFIDHEIMKKEYSRLLNTVNERDAMRDKHGKSLIYKRCPAWNFKSFYGDINNCYVKRYTIDI